MTSQSYTSNKLHKNNSSINRPLNINLKNNAWKCNCKTFDLISSISNQVNSSILINNDDTRLFKNSCYFNYFLNQNNPIFTNNNNFNFTEMINIKCLVKTNVLSKNASVNWLEWYNQNCLKHNTSHLLKITTSLMNSSTKSSLISFSNIESLFDCHNPLSLTEIIYDANYFMFLL